MNAIIIKSDNLWADLQFKKNKPLNEEIKYQDERVKINNIEHPNQGKVVRKSSPLKAILIVALVIVAVAAFVVFVLIMCGIIKI